MQFITVELTQDGFSIVKMTPDSGCNSLNPELADMKELGKSSIFHFVVLAAAWIAIVVFIDPVGEFMINDDWSFVRLLQSLFRDGELTPTGWGKGGPSALVHVLWGGLFTKICGFSVTTLRVSVLTLGVLGSFGFLVLLRACGANPWPALLGTLTLVFNPLFLSQCFTFMTDITFASLAIFSLLFLHLGIQTNRQFLIVLGLFCALAAILTRQIGFVIPVAFVVAVCVHPDGRRLGILKMTVLAVAICIVPWLAYECLLHVVGSTAVTQHQVFANILETPLKLGVMVLNQYVRLVIRTVGYIALLISPVLVPLFARLWPSRRFRLFAWSIAGLFVAVEAAILTGTIDPPTRFHPNVIFDFGIGPIVLKDTFILGIERVARMPKSIYYALLFWGLLAAGVLLTQVCFSLADWIRVTRRDGEPPGPFVALLSLAAGLVYIGVITLTGSLDRYFIPLFIFASIWLYAEVYRRFPFPRGLPGIAAVLSPLLLMGVFSTLMVSDFMSLKRSLTAAHDYLTHQLHVDPCNVDGGFEFNGYHCYRRGHTREPGRSWWWTKREDYVVTLGSLQDHEVVRVFPFRRYVGPNGAVFILAPRHRDAASMPPRR